MRNIRRLHLITFIFFAASYSYLAIESHLSFAQDTPKTEQIKSGTPPQPHSQKESNDFAEVILRDVANEVQTRLEKIRRLKFKEKVKKYIRTREEVRKYVIKTIHEEMPPEKLAAYQKILVKLRLIPPKLDVEKLIVDLLSEQIAAFYDDETKSLYMTTDSFSLMFKIYLLHEMTHALQDQYFQLNTLPINNENDDDLAMAIQAVVEGEATLTMLEYASGPKAKEKDVLNSLQTDTDESMLEIAGGEVFSKAPDFFKKILVFPYTSGASFVYAVKAKGGWEAVNKIYDDLPSSSEQILHPDKYILQRDEPVDIEISIPDLLASLGKDWKLIDYNVIGEFSTAILLEQFLPKQSEKPSAGWDGDRLYAFENSANRSILLVWFSTWDSERDAREFFDAYRTVVQKKYESETLLMPVPQKQIEDVIHHQGTTIAKKSKSLTDSCLWKTEQDGVYIERRGSDVLILEGFPLNKLQSLKAPAWKATKSPKKAIRKSNLKSNAKYGQ